VAYHTHISPQLNTCHISSITPFLNTKTYIHIHAKSNNHSHQRSKIDPLVAFGRVSFPGHFRLLTLKINDRSLSEPAKECLTVSNNLHQFLHAHILQLNVFPHIATPSQPITSRILLKTYCDGAHTKNWKNTHLLSRLSYASQTYPRLNPCTVMFMP
jgi:hypothetical protein